LRIISTNHFIPYQREWPFLCRKEATYYKKAKTGCNRAKLLSEIEDSPRGLHYLCNKFENRF
ncbi:MAG: hypothetical protein PHG06_14460, partial [Parabacteroides sp.]|nr:hypothetical protein [Parabacteroides sp.]